MSGGGPDHPSRPLPDLGLTDDVAWAIVESAPDAIVVVDDQELVVLANDAAAAQFGYERDELIGLSVHALLPERLRAVHAEHHAGYRAAPRTRPMGMGMSLLGCRKDSTEFPVEISLSPITVDDRTMAVAVVRDITERAAADQRLRATEEELRTLEDHERIARDLHDIVIQQLFASGMTLQGAWPRIKEPEIAQRVAAVVDDLDRTIRKVRSAIFGLESMGNDTHGRRAEIMLVVSECGANLSSQARVHFDGPVETIGDEIQEELLATVREALSNVVRHAGATAVDLTVHATRDEVILRVTDDGNGIDENTSAGNGLRNMRERAERLGGRCDVRGRPDGGTVVEWVVPRGTNRPSS